MTELMVVVGIIAVLAGILLTAMGGVRRRAMSTQSESTMQEFAKACEAFQIEHNRYPGIIPEQVLAELDTMSMSPLPMTGTENALVDLMGGARALSPLNPNAPDFNDIDPCDPDDGIICPDLSAVGWDLKVDVNRIGEGPKIDRRLYAPYFTPTEATLQGVNGQLGEPDPVVRIPDLVDAWGQPIIYVRRARSTGPLAGDVNDSLSPQFFTASMTPYTKSTALGAVGKDQKAASILNSTDPDADHKMIFAQIIRHPGFGTPEDPLNGTARGAFVLISAGPDGIYFSHQDGPGSPSEPIGSANLTYEDFLSEGPTVIKEFDDVRIFGGG
jgi:type II secretory pathway pseudopilin PulG